VVTAVLLAVRVPSGGFRFVNWYENPAVPF
jgi:hypothetical protein